MQQLHIRLYCLRKSASFDIREDFLQMFYTATINT